jgi:putative DNA primase/helicase
MSEHWTRVSALPDLRRIDSIALDLETKDGGLLAGRGSAWPWRGGYICGIGVAYRADGDIRSHYFPIRHPDSDNFDGEQVFQWLRDLFASGVRIIGQNTTYDFGWLRAEADITMPSTIEEIGALATLVDENRYQYSLDALCAWRGLPGKDVALLEQAVRAAGLAPKRKKKIRVQEHIWQLPANVVGPYGEADPANTFALWESLNPILDQENTRAAYRLECDLLPMVLEMRRRGIRIDTAAAERARDLLLQKRDTVFAEMSEKLGVAVGMAEIGRTKWLAETFDQHGISYPRTEKGNPSFTAGNSGWMPHHPHWLPRLIVKADKYNNAAVNFLETYVLGHVVNGRVHAEIHPHRSDEGGTRSLRFSYSSPPLQLMPAHDEELAPLIRGVFLPEEGEVWAKPDLSQQEFRFIVHYAARHRLSKAAEAVALYRNDPHTDFHKLVSEWTERDRQISKGTNFAKAFGAGVRKFAAMIGKSETEAQAIYDRYDRELPFVSQLSQLCERIVRKQGYLTLYDGARRHWNQWAPGGTWKKGLGPCSREEAFERVRDPEHPWYRKPLYRTDTRKAMNALIQGSAARHTKLWMRACWREGVVPLLQMHDALDCSVSSSEQAERVAQLGREVVKLEVPMEVDLAFGRNWGDATHAWEELHTASEKPTITFGRSSELEHDDESPNDDDNNDAPILPPPAWQIDWAEALDRDFPCASLSGAAVEPSASTAPERPVETPAVDNSDHEEARPAKPQTYNGDLDHLPSALMHLRQQKAWLCWCWFWDGKRWTKPPRRVDDPSCNASTSDPTTWGTYEQAIRQVHIGCADGIGFAVKGRNIGGVDLDHCRNPKTGELAPWAQEYLRQFPDAYVEATVSGRGLRILGRSTVENLSPKFKLPDRGNGAAVELFSNSNHYLTLSCNEIGSCAELPDIGDQMVQIAAELGKAKEDNGPPAGNGFDASGTTPWSFETELRLRSALNAIPADEKLLTEKFGNSHNIWVKIGMAIERLGWGDRGYTIFRDWSAQNAEKFDEAGLRTQWKSFNRNRDKRAKPVTSGSVFYFAHQCGWNETPHGAAASPGHSTNKNYVLVRASDIIPRPMDWLWEGHILRGSQELLTGIPGTGKSQIHCALVAAATTGGLWPDGCNGVPAGNVIMLTAEDCLDQIIIPRLIVAGANRERVFIFRKIRKDNKERMFLLNEDMEELEHSIKDTGDVRLVTIDPITAYMGGGKNFDSHRATDVRGQLGPLADLAERLDVALSAITHPPKHSTQRAIDHFIGSQAYIAAARIGHMTIEEIEEDANGQNAPTGRALFTNPKNNVSRRKPTLAYRIVEKDLDGGVKAASVAWEEIVDITADQAVAAAMPSKSKERGGAVMFLMDMVARGPAPISLIEERGSAHGYSPDQLKRAKQKLGVCTFRERGKIDGSWFWALPEDVPENTQQENEHGPVQK